MAAHALMSDAILDDAETMARPYVLDARVVARSPSVFAEYDLNAWPVQPC
jgi:hypothetical protein